MENSKRDSNQIGILWDMDGVLVDTLDYHYAAWREVFNEYSFVLSRDTYKETFGINNKHLIQSILGEDVSKKIIEEIHTKKESIYRDSLIGEDILYPGTKDTLELFKNADFVQVVTTSAPQVNIDAIMKATKIDSYFQLIFSCDGMASKQHPDAYLATAEKAGLAIDHCVVVEDSILGIQGAKAAGMKCIAISTTHSEKHLNQADLIVQSINDLKPEMIISLVEMNNKKD